VGPCDRTCDFPDAKASVRTTTSGGSRWSVPLNPKCSSPDKPEPFEEVIVVEGELNSVGV
jgi:hypothetical protein